MISTIFAPKFLVLYAFVASTLFVHFRGRERLRFARQLTDHSTFLAPVNCLLYAFSGVPNRPFLDERDLPELAAVRDNWQTIRDEAVALYSEGQIKKADGYDDLAFNSFFKRGWTRFYLKWYGDYLPSARTQCPKTVEILDQIPTVHAALFAVLPPGASLVAHRDPFAGSLRYHLGLVTPNDDRCRIYIDGEPYSWRDGKGVVFDETYVHRAINETDVHRIILFCDVERPMRNRLARAANRFLCHHVVKASQTRNEEGEKVGALNRAFRYVYRVRLAAKAFKRYNRKAYYAVKYAAIAGVLAWIFV